MNYRKLNTLSDVYFGLILFMGISYLAFLAFALIKIFPGLAMQVIFFLDAIKFNHDIFALIISKVFLFNFIPGILLMGLMARFGKSLVVLVKNIWQTFQMIKKINIVKSIDGYSEFKSNNLAIFTVGFLKPRIYISQAIFKANSKSEIEAMREHEANHQNNLHPLKIFVSNFIKSFMPTIPGRDLLFGNYLTSTEVASDAFAESKTKTKTPLVSALLKFQDQSFEALPTSISYFNSKSERIKILVGQKKPSQVWPMIYSSIVIGVIMISALSVEKTNIFYECSHILKCVETLATPNGPSLISSDHCQ